MVYQDANISGMVQLFQYANTATDGIFGVGILLSTLFIVYLNLSFGDNTKAFAVASWVTALIAVFLRLMTVVNDLVMYITFVIVLISLVALRGNQQDF